MLLHYAYNYFYLEMIYEIIINAQWPYYFINPIDPQVITSTYEDCCNSLPDVNMDDLALDISKRGTYFPFYGLQWDKITGVRQGKHRWCGLQRLGLDRNYLFIPYNNQIATVAHKIKIPAIDIDALSINFVCSDSSDSISKLWYQYSEQVANLLKLHNNDSIEPFRGWDTEEILMRFLAAENEFAWLKTLQE